jgi:hypothetical protein
LSTLGSAGGKRPYGAGGRRVVRFWAMRPLCRDFRPHDEVDEARRLPLTEAPDELSHAADRAVLAGRADALS